MDWRRAKTILIIIFILLDLFLGYQWWENRSIAMEEAWLNRDKDYLQTTIKNHQIKLETTIPTEKPKLSYINVTYDTAELMQPHEGRQMIKKNEYTVIGFLYPRVPLPPNLNLANLPNELGEMIPHFSQYRYYNNTAQDEWVYVQQFEGYPIFGAHVILYEDDQSIQKFEQTYLQVVEQGNQRDLLSAAASLQNLLDLQIISDGSTIKQVELGYLGQPFTPEIQEQVFVPVWKIGLTDDIIYVNAVTGLVESRPNLAEAGQDLEQIESNE